MREYCKLRRDVFDSREFFYERFKKLMEENFWKLYTAVSSCANPLVLEYKNKVYNKNMWRINFFERYSTFKETKQIKLATKHGMRHSIGPLRCYNESRNKFLKQVCESFNACATYTIVFNPHV